MSTTAGLHPLRCSLNRPASPPQYLHLPAVHRSPGDDIRCRSGVRISPAALSRARPDEASHRFLRAEVHPPDGVPEFDACPVPTEVLELVPGGAIGIRSEV